MCRYLLITPVKDEIQNFPSTINSLMSQHLLPAAWIIIEDGSTDGTRELVKDLEDKFSWIKAIYNEPGVKRQVGGEFILKQALDIMNIDDYDYLIKMDADLVFEKDLFRKIFEEFENDTKLGIAGGSVFIQHRGRLIEEGYTELHTRGPLKFYRRECYKDIEGIEPNFGWDTIDEIKARMAGWRTKTIRSCVIIHMRPTQTAQGFVNGMKNMAKASYYIGYHPLFLMVRGIIKMRHKPYVVGGLSMIAEYLLNYFKRNPRISDENIIRYVRKQQVRKLLGKKSERT
jgi:poly-beta-1,6-N-acetyl-D-glucosamine synthase